MSRIFWDSNLFIYFLEGNDERALATKKLRSRMMERADQLYTSTLSIGEILVKPAAQGNRAQADLYEEVLYVTATVLPFDRKAARCYAEIRATTAIKGPDAVQLACAGAVGMDLFITNDFRLHGKQAPGIQFIVPLQSVPL